MGASDRSNLPAAIAIVDNRGDLVCFARQDGATQFRSKMALKKAYTSAQFRRGTRELGERLAKPEGLDITMFDLIEYTAMPGGEPIFKPGDDSLGIGE